VLSLLTATKRFNWCYISDEFILVVVNFKLTWACAFGFASLASIGTALATPDTVALDNPYSVINDRNVFHLNPPPPPKDVDAPKPVELPKVALTGFVGKGSSIRVLLAIPPAKDSKETSFTYLTLGPGDRDHDVQLVKIRPESFEVEIMNGGTLQTLTKSNTLASLGPTPHIGGGGGGLGEKGEKGERGLHRPMIPGFNPPQPGTPAAPLGAQGGRGGGSLVVGGSEGSGGGAIVSGGGSGGNGALIAGGGGGGGQAYVGGGGGVSYAGGGAANNIGNQLTSALLNQNGSHYVAPTPTGPPLPPVVQAAVMNLQKAATGGGPPLPPGTEMPDEGGGPPPPNE
jgi:hypothetical protein